MNNRKSAWQRSEGNYKKITPTGFGEKNMNFDEEKKIWGNWEFLQFFTFFFFK